VLQVIVEVGLRHGGRQITVRSVMSVMNRTNHSMRFLLSPNATFTPNKQVHSATTDPSDIESSEVSSEEDTVVMPGELFQIPTLLLESSLRHEKTHLGYMWMRPTHDRSAKESSPMNQNNLSCHDCQNDVVGYSSKPVSFSNIVDESADLFAASRFRNLSSDQVTTKLELSCPVTSPSGHRVAPICYAMEIDRSPIVRDHTNAEKAISLEHSPVAYTMVIHPPIVITNHLACSGRFELMHAANRTVMWSGDLAPGQQVAVHSVGLDAPLFLFLNIGFAKTPEGALVHHGPDPPLNTRGKVI
jgi:hypothetical protein